MIKICARKSVALVPMITHSLLSSPQQSHGRLKGALRRKKRTVVLPPLNLRFKFFQMLSPPKSRK